MPPFQLPLTIRTTSGRTDLVVQVAPPAQIGPQLPAIRAAAGLPADAALYHGCGQVDPSWLLGSAPLLAAAVLATNPDDPQPVRGRLELACISGPDAGHRCPLEPGNSLLVGRAEHSDLRLDDPSLSRVHATVRVGPAGLMLADLASANGIRVDGGPVGEQELLVPPGALIRLGGSILQAIPTLEPGLLLGADGAGRLVVARPARLQRSFRAPSPAGPGVLPPRTRRPIPLLAAAIGAVAGGAIAVLTGMWTFLLLAALGPVMMVGSAVGDRTAGRRRHRRRLTRHQAAVSVHDRALLAAVAADRIDAWDRYPDPATLLLRAEAAGHRLWERRPADLDFLQLSVGVGQRSARLDVPDPPLVCDVPITVDICRLGVLGVVGLLPDTRPLLRFLLSQLAALHAPSDLQIVLCTAATDLIPVRDLPHLATGSALGAVIATAAELSTLNPPAPPVLRVVILDGAHHWRYLPRVRDLLQAAVGRAEPAPGSTERDRASRRSGPPAVVAICVDVSAAALPAECTAVATVTRDRVVVHTADGWWEAEKTGVDEVYLDRLVRALAPLRDLDAAGSQLPDGLAWSELAPGSLTEAAVRSVWRHPRLATMIGAGVDGPVELDLEKDGPHLLIAGTTGSGKSELLQTLVAGLAMAAGPEYVSFLLVDYKGGAAFGALGALPHTTGVVTDLDGELAARALTSLRAEVRRREQLLVSAAAVDLAQLRAEQPAAGCPSLVIVVDEFATLAAELPTFLTGLVDVAQRGRSLGVHLVLATQRPAGILSAAVKANMSARICLRVADVADSLDVIDVPDAARLPPGLPGRAVLRTGPHGTQIFQTARVTVSPPAGTAVRLRDVAKPADDLQAGREVDMIVAAVTAAAVGVDRPRPSWRAALPTRIVAQPEHTGTIALLDRPETADQVAVPLPATSVLVAGPPGSGRTGALRRLARCWAEQGAEILLVDGAGLMSDVAGWPATSSALDGTDPVLLAHLLVRLQLETAARSGRPQLPMLLVMDGFESLLAPLDLLDYGASSAIVGELAGRGPSAGLRVAAAGDLRAVHHRLAAQFGTRILLAVDPRGEPRTGSPPGRGRIGLHEIQLLHDPPGTPPPGRVPDHRRRLVVRPLPQLVTVAELPVPTASAVPIGCGGDEATPVLLDLSTAGGGWLISGPRRSGVSTALRTIAIGAAGAGITALRTVARPSASWPGVQNISIRQGSAELERRLIDHQGPVLLICDGLDREHPANDLLLRFLAVAQAGQFLVLGARLDVALRSHSGVIAETAAHRSGVLLQADATDGSLLDARLPRRRGPVVPGRGHLCRDGEVVEVQIALPSNEPGDSIR